MDGFDKKHEMIQLLMHMLKKNAADEVGGYSQKEQITHTPVPKGSVADMPHKKTDYKPGASPAKGEMPMEGTTMGNMSHGGMVDLTKEQHMMKPTSEDKHMAEGGEVNQLREPNNQDGTYHNNSSSDTVKSLAQQQQEALGYADGGMIDADKEVLNNLPEKPQDEEGQEESRQTLHNENMIHEDEDNNSSSFSALFPRKKKK